MKRFAVVLAALAVAFGVALPAQASTIERHHYVANDFASFVLAGESQSTGIAVDGTVLFKAAADHAAVKLADRVARGTVPVIIDTTDGRRSQCVSVGHVTRIDGLVAGEWVGLTLLDATYHGACHAGATVGLLTIFQ